MSQIYEASVHAQVIKYRNFKGVEQVTELFFALDPLQLLQVIAEAPIKTTKSGNPARAGKQELSDGDQLKFVRDLACKAAGFPSDDGETWEKFPDFEDSLVGKAFLTKLAASDDDRKAFAEKVILDPFRAFVNFAKAEPGNSKSEVAQFETMLKQLENVFVGAPEGETLEQKRERLALEMAALDGPAEGTQGVHS